MSAPRVCILTTDGINRDQETAHAFSLVGASAQRVHVNELAARPKLLDDVAILAIPGGFSYGDDISAGRVLAVELAARLGETVRRFIDRDGLVMGICNGFQVLVRSGLLPFGTLGTQAVSLARNTSGHFECRWVRLRVESSESLFTEGCGGQTWEFPIAHGEGRIVAEPSVLDAIEARGHVTLRYVDENGSPTMAYPVNPNGSPAAIAGLTDATGRVFGLMPHPECSAEPHHHPNWRRRDSREKPDGLWLFENAVRAVSLRRVGKT